MLVDAWRGASPKPPGGNAQHVFTPSPHPRRTTTMAAIVEAQKQAEPIGSLEQATGGASNKIGDGG